MSNNVINGVLAVIAIGLIGWMFLGKSDSASEVPQEFVSVGSTTFDVEGTEVKLVETRDANGILQERGQVLNGLKTGIWTVYHPDARIKSISSYAGGKLNGLYMEMNNRGQVELEAGYKNGNLDGSYIKYKSGSRKLEERNYVNGKLNGLFRKYNERKNTISQEINYKDGLQHGSLKYYDEEGNITMEYEYKDGEKISGGIVEKKAGE